MSRRFCVVYHVDTDFRLMETSAGEPAVWRMEMLLDSVSSNIEVRDLIRVENEIPLHSGLHLAVMVSASDIDTGVEIAGRLGETVVSLLSVAARAYAPELQPFVAYEITDSIAERAFIQWFPMPSALTGKVSVPAAAFGRLFEQLPSIGDERIMQRVRLALDWHRIALRETEPLVRFIHLWIALESIGNLVAEHYSVETGGWQGLRRLASDEGYSESTIPEILAIRSHIFHGVLHGKRLAPADIRPQANALIPRIEQLLLAGWLRLLNSYSALPNFPGSSTSRHPMRHIVKGTILKEDIAQWGNGIHPHFVGEMNLQRKTTSELGKVTVSYVLNARPMHFDQWQGREFEVWGPSGPNMPNIEQSVQISNQDEL